MLVRLEVDFGESLLVEGLAEGVVCGHTHSKMHTQRQTNFALAGSSWC